MSSLLCLCGVEIQGGGHLLGVFMLARCLLPLERSWAIDLGEATADRQRDCCVNVTSTPASRVAFNDSWEYMIKAKGEKERPLLVIKVERNGES